VTNAAAEEVNTSELQKLAQPVFHFLCLDGSQRSGDDPCTPRTNARHAASCKSFWDNCSAEPEVQYALGAQVALLAFCRFTLSSFHCLTLL
jgi:hypothetical protein